MLNRINTTIATFLLAVFMLVPSIANAKTFQSGMASWYGAHHHGKRTASGERFNMNGLTAAHKTLAFGTRVQVKDVKTGKAVIVKITDRGPYAHGRIIDLSKGAAKQLGIDKRGVGKVELTVLSKGDGKYKRDDRMLVQDIVPKADTKTKVDQIGQLIARIELKEFEDKTISEIAYSNADPDLWTAYNSPY